jgi:hypothetical protein
LFIYVKDRLKKRLDCNDDLRVILTKKGSLQDDCKNIGFPIIRLNNQPLTWNNDYNNNLHKAWLTFGAGQEILKKVLHGDKQNLCEYFSNNLCNHPQKEKKTCSSNKLNFQKSEIQVMILIMIPLIA